MRYICIPGKRKCFQNYYRAAVRCGGTVVSDPAEAELLILPGGGDIEPWRYGAENTASRGFEPRRDEEELKLTEQFLQAGKPVIGICRGMQLLNVFFGGTLVQDIPGHSQMAGEDRFHATAIAASCLRELYGKALVVNSAHHQAVQRLGKGLREIQWAEDGVVEAIQHERFPVLGLQWHPERLGKQGLRLFYRIMEDCKNF
ncbi:MAG: gamma-glutamyl-gamma-aminobutyrate hydrolase family protein [Oscillibacter sp.]|nr:gamma-glutamyl-gamma-aminobutyrate hydrolase family protein [Oscillibacter sp.]